MTFIKPNKNKNFLNGILALLAVALVIGTFGMVAFYNTTVNLSHNITAAKTELDAVGAQSTEMNNKIVATLTGNDLTQLAANAGLVTESKPTYFPLTHPISQK